MSLYDLVTSDGLNLSSFGVVVHRVLNGRNAPTNEYELRGIPGREDSVLMTLDGSTRPRQLIVEGWQKAGDVPALMQNRDRLLWYLQNRTLDVRVVDQAGRYIVGRVEQHDIRPIDPFATQRAHQFRLTLLCADPRWLDDAETSVAFGAGETQVPLGTAITRPVVTVTGPLAAPYVLSLKDAGGAEVAYMRMTVALGSGERRVFDCAATTIIDPDDLPADQNRAHEWDGCKFWRFDPRNASSPNGPWPTISINPAPASAVADYRIAWL